MQNNKLRQIVDLIKNAEGVSIGALVEQMNLVIKDNNLTRQGLNDLIVALKELRTTTADKKELSSAISYLENAISDATKLTDKSIDDKLSYSEKKIVSKISRDIDNVKAEVMLMLPEQFNASEIETSIEGIDKRVSLTEKDIKKLEKTIKEIKIPEVSDYSKDIADLRNTVASIGTPNYAPAGVEIYHNGQNFGRIPSINFVGGNVDVSASRVDVQLATPSSGGVIDGDKGDITVTGGGTIWTLDDDTVGLDELSATGTPSASTFLRGDNTWATVPALSDGDKGDITVSSSGTVWEIDAGVVTETELNASVNASLDLADTAVQPAGLTNYFLKTADDTDDITVGTVNKFATAAEKTKLGFISVTQAVDLDTIESDTATNNAKVTNATHTGEVTGSGALTVDKTAITGKTAVTAVGTDYILISDTSDSGNLKKALASDLTGSGGTPGGSNTQIQFNDSSSFGGDAGLTYSKTNDTLTITSDSSGNGLIVQSAKGAGAGTENLVVIQTTDSLWDRPLLRINDNTSSGGAANIRIDSLNPDIEFVETDQTTPAGKFEVAVNSDKFQINGRSAADTGFEPIATFSRYGSGGMVGIGTLYDTPNAMLEVVTTGTPSYNFSISSAVGASSGNIFNVDGSGNVIINDRGSAIATRIEGDTDANLFYTDGTNDRVGIGLNNPSQKLHVKGRVQFGVASNTSGTIDLANSGAAGLTRIAPSNPGSDITVTLPSSAGTLALTSDLSSKQDTLVSGTNIKTINGSSILGAGDLSISGVGTGTANTITYWDTTTSIASLDTATYPSLTELSYVKGVTSAIQTQLNAKGTGNVTKVGTPVDNQVGVWTGDGTLEGSTNLTFDGSSLKVAGIISPITDDATALGTTTLGFSDLFLASGGVINWNNGNATLTHSSGLLTSNVDIVVPDEAYGSGWNGSTEVPTKNAVYDKIETLSYTPAYLGITATPNSAQTTVANTAYTLAITVPVACTITKVAVYIGVSSGNIDVGIYNSSGTRLGSSGSVASPGTGSRLISLSSSVDLTPGFYYLAVAANNATISLGRYSTDNLLGSGAVATSFPLPSTITTPIAVSSRAYSIAGVVSGGVTQ